LIFHAADIAALLRFRAAFSSLFSSFSSPCCRHYATPAARLRRAIYRFRRRGLRNDEKSLRFACCALFLLPRYAARIFFRSLRLMLLFSAADAMPFSSRYFDAAIRHFALFTLIFAYAFILELFRHAAASCRDAHYFSMISLYFLSGAFF